MISIDDMLGRFEQYKRLRGDDWLVTCPAHADRSPSLHLTLKDGRWLLHCLAGCSHDAVLEAAGLAAEDLTDSADTNGRRREVETYQYVDESGRLLFEVVRFEPKDFRQRQPSGAWNLKGVRRVLYRLPQGLEQAARGGAVWIVEGERDVHALERAGVVATTNPAGAGKWRPEYSEALRGADVVIVADRDEPGRKRAADVAQAVEGIAATVRVVEAIEGKDARDHLRAGHPLDAFRDVRQSGPDAPVARAVKLTKAVAIAAGRVRWLWESWIPLRGLVVVAGEPGLGKSTFTNALLVAKLTRGTLEGELAGRPVDVLIATAEDDWASVVKPRLMATGADLERVHRVEVVDPAAGGTVLTLPGDVRLLEEAIERLRAERRMVGLLVVDPIGAFLSDSTDSHKDAHVRRALAPLADLAMRLDLVVLAVAHLNKDSSQRLLQRLSGAGAFGAAPRSVIGFARDPDDPEGDQGADRVIVHAKSNWGRYATSLAARVESRVVETEDGPTDVGYVRITGESSVGVEDLQAGGQRDDRAAVGKRSSRR